MQAWFCFCTRRSQGHSSTAPWGQGVRWAGTAGGWVGAGEGGERREGEGRGKCLIWSRRQCPSLFSGLWVPGVWALIPDPAVLSSGVFPRLPAEHLSCLGNEDRPGSPGGACGRRPLGAVRVAEGSRWRGIRLDGKPLADPVVFPPHRALQAPGRTPSLSHWRIPSSSFLRHRQRFIKYLLPRQNRASLFNTG